MQSFTKRCVICLASPVTLFPALPAAVSLGDPVLPNFLSAVCCSEPAVKLSRNIGAQ